MSTATKSSRWLVGRLSGKNNLVICRILLPTCWPQFASSCEKPSAVHVGNIRTHSWEASITLAHSSTNLNETNQRSTRLWIGTRWRKFKRTQVQKNGSFPRILEKRQALSILLEHHSQLIWHPCPSFDTASGEECHFKINREKICFCWHVSFILLVKEQTGDLGVHSVLASSFSYIVALVAEVARVSVELMVSFKGNRKMPAAVPPTW